MESSRVLKICIVILIISTALIVTVGVIKIKKINSEKEVIINLKIDMEDKIKELQLQLDEANSDEFVEENARELGLVKPGEELVIVAEPSDSGTYNPIQAPINDLEIGD